MKRFEYCQAVKREDGTWTAVDLTGEPICPVFDTRLVLLNIIGFDGWELVTIDEAGALILKREMQS